MARVLLSLAAFAFSNQPSDDGVHSSQEFNVIDPEAKHTQWDDLPTVEVASPALVDCCRDSPPGKTHDAV